MTEAELIFRLKTLDPGTSWSISAPALADALGSKIMTKKVQGKARAIAKACGCAFLYHEHGHDDPHFDKPA
jgi:hypothetical protein